jgi:kynurenine formamidase
MSATRRHLPRYEDLPEATGGGRSGWGMFGEDDSIGLVNLMTPDRVVEAARLVRRGAVFSLNAAIDAFDPPLARGRGQAAHRVLHGDSDAAQGLDDALDNFYPQISSQWDSLAHIAAEPGVFYNGASVADVREGGHNTIDHLARRGIATRGVLLDAERTVDRETAHGSSALSVADLEATREAAGVEYSPGCAVLIRTGFLSWYGTQTTEVRTTLPRKLEAPGIEHTEEMAAYLWDHEIAAVAADTFAVEVWPPDWRPEARPFGFLHHVLIGRLGMSLGELWDLDALAADCDEDGTNEFFLVSAPLHVRGGIGSTANALAIK